MQSAIVIGAGIGGITAAARLARAGYKVTVLEKAAVPGGRAGVITHGQYRFDTGPTLFLMPEVFAETFAALGENMADHLKLQRVDPVYRLHFNDGTRLDLTSNLPELREQLEAMEPGAFNAFLRFMAEGERNYRLSLKHFVGRNFYSLAEYFSLANLPLLFQLKALIKHADNTGRFFRDPRLRAAFSFQNMYLGLSPYDAPATYSLLQYTELADGVYFPEGGLYRVIERLAAIAEGLGVRFLYSTPAQEIVVEGQQATAVRLADGKLLRADVIVANADLPYVYERLLPDDGTARRLMQKVFTSSALMFYWGVRGKRAPELLHHNVFLADHRYRESFNTIFHEHGLPEQPSFYVNAAARTETGFAPPDGDSLMVLVPAGHLDSTRPQPWAEWRARAKEAVLQRMAAIGIHDLAPRIEFEATKGPEDYERDLNLARGAAFGLSHNFTQVGYLRPHNRHPRYKNLFFVGASTHPGTGLPIVLLSAKHTVARILKELPAPARAPQSAASPLVEQPR